jgi:hypothetical protein
MTEDGIHLHVTAKGKLLVVTRKGDQSITFQLTLHQAKQLSREIQSTTAQLKKAVGETDE